jgi:hypothetical protein
MSIEEHSSAADSRIAVGLFGFKAARLPACVVAAALLAGCAHRYDMTLTNGIRVTNVTKPVLDRQVGVYTYKDVVGNVKHVSAGRVVDISPHSSKNTTPGTLQQ